MKLLFPIIQRPFVWKNTKVRDLFDSMYLGYPIGYLLFWESGATEGGRSIGDEKKQKAPRLLIVDGQQRLTALYAVIRGIAVVRENYKSEKIEIAFNPLTEKFEVADAAIRNDKSYIPNISQLWAEGLGLFDIARSYIKNLESVRELTPDEIKKIENSISKLYGLMSYPFTALELAINVNEEQVSEVFVRINSAGKKLEQADFILTLMSVFWDEGRADLERFCREAMIPTSGNPSPYNHFIRPLPSQLLRVSIGVAFKRARLQNVYSILRGKDLETEEFSPAKREEQFAILKGAQERVLNLQYWHDFFKITKQAGYRSGDWISSEANLMFAYTLYLIGRTEYGVDEFRLREAQLKWFFMSSLTARFSGSSESKMEFDFARFREVTSGDEFIKVLERICDDVLTNDFWEIGLPNQLATSSARNPALFAYNAALNLLDAKVLFSKHKISELADPSVHSNRADIERHHLFPKEYLRSIGITEVRDTNQTANFAFVEWGDNGAIGKDAPSVYLPTYLKRFSGQDLQKMYHWHALPDNWENLDYQDFLIKRRDLISNVIKEAYFLLKTSPTPSSGNGEVSVDSIIAGGETSNLEFKSSLRVNLHTGHKDARMEMSVIKTIAGFLNGKGGTLLVGVNDDGEPLGIETDDFENEDKMLLHLTNLTRDKISPQHMMYIHPHFIEMDGKRILSVECNSARSPAYVKDGSTERFFIRTGASTSELSLSQAQEFMRPIILLEPSAMTMVQEVLKQEMLWGLLMDKILLMQGRVTILF